MAAVRLSGRSKAHRGRPVVYVYSHAYDIRNRIHHDASYAMLPLFGAEAFLGERLYTYPTRAGTLRAWHNAVAISIYSLFAVNTVTGAWNLWEGRKDPNGRTLRFVHGLLMLAADSLFVATAASTPDSRTLAGLKTFENQKRAHLDLAVASISTAMTGYVIMLFRH